MQHPAFAMLNPNLTAYNLRPKIKAMKFNSLHIIVLPPHYAIEHVHMHGHAHTPAHTCTLSVGLQVIKLTKCDLHLEIREAPT